MIFIIGLLVGYANAACYLTYDIRGCNDNEMFNQCNYAQQQINDYANLLININDTYELIKHMPNMKCSQYIVCGGSAYCQNMDSYKACLNATTELDGFITIASEYINIPVNLLESKPVFVCEKKDIINGYSVTDYYENSGNNIVLPLFLVLSTIFLCT